MSPARILLCALTLVAQAAFAQGANDPIPYPDEEEDHRGELGRKLPRRSDPTTDFRDESEEHYEDPVERLSSLDDPNVGLAAEALSGLMLLDSSRGQLAEPRFAYGFRFTWELGRVLPEEALREALFADVSWTYAALRDGTAEIFGDTNYHYFTVAPAYAFALGKLATFYLQAGGGLAYQFSALHVGASETQLAGVKPLFSYGLGFRGRPAIAADESLRLTWRVELTRLRRGYMDDTFLGGSLGFAF